MITCITDIGQQRWYMALHILVNTGSAIRHQAITWIVQVMTWCWMAIAIHFRWKSPWHLLLKCIGKLYSFLNLNYLSWGQSTKESCCENHYDIYVYIYIKTVDYQIYVFINFCLTYLNENKSYSFIIFFIPVFWMSSEMKNQNNQNNYNTVSCRLHDNS